MLGVYYDGKSTEPHPCSLSVDTNGRVELDGYKIGPVSIVDIDVSTRVGTTPRFVNFPAGACFETEDHHAADLLNVQVRRANGEKSRQWFIAHRWESSFRLAFIAISVMIGLVVFLALVGIPGISGWVARQLPAEVSSALGKGSLELLDERYFRESKLPIARQQQLETLFTQLIPKNDDLEYRLNFRDGGIIGANAFALPNGQVIITDALVALADSDDEIRAVLLHEIAHVVHRHSLKQLIGGVSLFAIYGLMIGDLDTMNNVMVYLPVILVQTGYSREAEWEADGYALNTLLASNVSPKYFAVIMRKLEKDQSPSWFLRPTESKNKGEKKEQSDTKQGETSSKSEPKESNWLSYLSSHPITQDRINRFENAIP